MSNDWTRSEKIALVALGIDALAAFGTVGGFVVGWLSLGYTNSPKLTQSLTIDCSKNTYNCADFATQQEAQRVFDSCKNQTGSDIHQLDRDNDSVACEERPRMNGRPVIIVAFFILVIGLATIKILRNKIYRRES
jgi:hypothetical protein